MHNEAGDIYCEKYDRMLGEDNITITRVNMFCQFYDRDHNCWLESIIKAEAEREEKERIEREKEEAKEKALFDKLIADASKKIQANPNDAEAYNFRAGAYSQRKECNKAIDDYNKAIQLSPNNAEFYAFRGAMYNQKEEYEQALIDFNEAIRIDTKCKNAYAFRAGLYTAKKEYDKSISDYEEALKIDPKDSVLTSILANVKEEKAEAKSRQKEEKKQRFFSIFRMVLGGIIGGFAFVFFASVAPAGIFRFLFAVLIFIIAFRHKSNNCNDGFLWFLAYLAISLTGSIGILVLLNILPSVFSIVLGVIAGALTGRFISNIKRALF
jgi:tetratricopeptide (TPR) repeat protein